MKYRPKGTVEVLREILLVGLAVIGSCLIGCGRTPHSRTPTAPATVTITYGGEPVTEGQVDLNNDETGLGAGGPLDSQGKVVLSAVPLGEYTVTVLPPSGDPLPPPPGQPPPPAKQTRNIPAKVRSPRTSPLQVQVEKNSPNQFQFDLKEADQRGKSPSAR